MPRKPRVVAIGCPHHVTQRGCGRRQTFFTDHDRETYLRLLTRYAEQYEIELLGYCLMSNHVHVIATPRHENSLANAFGRAHADYARYANVLLGSCGHFWQERFYSCALDGCGSWNAVAYVERNPVRAGMVEDAADYPWSSAAAHAAGFDPRGILAMDPWEAEYTPSRWSEALRLGIGEEAFQRRLRRATESGLPLGDEAFVKLWEERLDRDLQIRGRGRPPKKGTVTNCTFS